MRENKIGILAVQETHLTIELAEQFTNLFGNTYTLLHSPDPHTTNARGIALILNKRIIDPENANLTVLIPGRALTVNIPWHDNNSLNILTVYSPNAPGEIKDFWKSIQEHVSHSPNPKPNVVLGDFNLIEDALDRLPCKMDDHRATTALRTFKTSNKLIDGWRTSHPEEKGYTWMRESDGTQSRIDRIYVHESFFSDCKSWEISHPPIPTDHDMVSAEISTPTAPLLGRGRWAIPTRLLKNKSMKREIQKLGSELEANLRATDGRTQQRNPQAMLRDFKNKTLQTLRMHERKTQPLIKMNIAKLSETLTKLRNDPDLPEDEIKIATVQIKKQIQCLTRETHQHARDRLAAIDAAEGEKIGKTWSSRHKTNKPRDTIKRLKTSPNETTTNSKKMAEVAGKYHYDLQFADHTPYNPPNAQKLSEALRPIKTRLSNASKEKLSIQISEDEVRRAIKKSTNDKAPGLDGIPIELWKSLDDQFRSGQNDPEPNNKCNIVWSLTQVYQDIKKFGMDRTAKLNEGCVSPIYKKKDPEDIANYRPITLLNTDYKILTKALSIRLAEVAPDIINTDQAGFIPNRSIFDQVKTTKLVIDYMDRFNKPGAIIALDQEKAYDKILHPYLWEVLKKFEFPNSYINTIKALYEHATSTIMINGELSEPFQILRGVRQGDALSCLLFNLAIEPLAECIRTSPLITGIRIPGTRKHLKVKLFADDTTVALSNVDKLENLQAILNDWCEVSGAKFNIEKTEIIPLGNKAQRDIITTMRKLGEDGDEIPNNLHIAKDGEPVRILGAWLGNNIDQATTWSPLIENVSNRLKRWGAAKHSLEGRRLIIQMQVAGVTQYLSKVQGMPKEIEKELDSMTRKFMWNYEPKDTVNRAQMNAPHSKGGKNSLTLKRGTKQSS